MKDGGIINQLVDVRDMLCTQALAMAAQAMERLNAGEALQILYNAADVKHDLLIWASDRGYEAQEEGTEQLWIVRSIVNRKSSIDTPHGQRAES